MIMTLVCGVGVNQMEKKLSTGKHARQANPPSHESAARVFQKEPQEDSENVQQRIVHGVREVCKKCGPGLVSCAAG